MPKGDSGIPDQSSERLGETKVYPAHRNRHWVRRVWEPISVVLAVIALADLTKQLIEWAQFIHFIATRYAAVREFVFLRLPFHVPHAWHDVIVLLCVAFTATNVGYYRRTKSNLLLQFVLFGSYPIWTGIRNVVRLFQVVDVGAVAERSLALKPYVPYLRALGEWSKPFSTKTLAITSAWEKRLTIFDQLTSLMNALPKHPLMTGNTRVANMFGCLLALFCVAFFVGVMYLTTTLAPSFPFFLSLGSFAFLVAIFVAWRWILVTIGSFALVAGVNAIYVNWLM